VLEMKMDLIYVEDRFEQKDDSEDVFPLEIDAGKLQLINLPQKDLPDWTQLEFHQCPNCPLDVKTTPDCPAAVNMVGLVKRFDHLLSYDKTNVVVITEDRTVTSQTTIQYGVCSLMGLLMAVSNCPLTAFFKPMARFHLPFASTQETIWRATSIYMLAQYFLQKEGRQPDSDFKGLSRLYEEIQDVNIYFARRLRSACQYDSMVNAIILLDLFAKSIPTTIEESLEELRHLYIPLLSYIDPA
jgi:hypothetical protein